MLIEFSVTNYRSFLTSQTLSLVANTSTELQDQNSFATPVKDLRLLRSAVIYGPNAAGKSNLVQALGEMQDFVRSSAKDSQADEEIPLFTPFLLSSKSRQAPSEFEVLFIQNNIRYQYGFAVNSTRVMHEWLLAYPEGRVQRWFEREYDDQADKEQWYFGPKFTGRKKIWQEATRSNALFLSTAIQLNNEQLKPVFNWFNKLAVIGQEQLIHPGFTIRECEDKTRKKKILQLLNSADLSIADITLIKRELTSDAFPDMPPEIKEELLKKRGERKLVSTKVDLLHTAIDTEELIPIPLEEESGGTKKLFAYAAPLLDVLENGRILVVDELDNSLHPLMVRYLIGLLHDGENNSRNAQLVFTTHDTSLLDQEVLRRDQIWFVEKNKHNATELYPLTDFSPRKREALEKGYLLGRYGALPYIRELRI